MPSKTFTPAFAVCLFLVIVAAKWVTFDRFGSPLPDWDQWDAEGGELFIPWHGSDRFLSHLFHPHNEHRVVLTKLQNLTLGLLNGQWDSRVEAATNALLHALLAVALWLAGRRWGAGRWLAPLFVVLVALFGLPVAWQNVLGGFHSQQYWLLALSFLTVVTLPFFPAWSKPWWLGALAAIAVLGSMGSGLLASAAVLIVIGWRWLRRETTFRALWPTLALGLGVIALGLLTRVDVEWHRHMKAKSVHDFVFSIIHSMQWPWRDRDWAALVLWLPWLVAAGRVLTSPRSPAATLARAGEPNQPPASLPPAGPAIVALGGWVLLQLAATAYARGAGADYPASRYMDTLSFGAAINALALAWLLSRADFSRRLRLPLYALGLGWVVTLGLGLHALLGGVIGGELPSAKDYYNKAEGHMRRYVATLDPKMLAYQDIPYPSAQGLIDPLSVPSLRAMMPVPIRPPLSLAAASPATSAFRENNAIQADIVRPPRRGLSPATAPLDSTRSWGSFDDTGTGAAAQGEWRSAPLPPPPPRSGWLRFETAGQLGQPGLALEVRDAATDALLATVRPSKVPGDAWRSTVVRAPRVAYRLVARDADSTRWFAFSGPIEMGSLSYWAWQATKHSLLLLYASSAATLLFAGLALVSRMKLRD